MLAPSTTTTSSTLRSNNQAATISRGQYATPNQRLTLFGISTSTLGSSAGRPLNDGLCR